MTENGDGLLDAEIPDCQGLFEAIHAKPIRMLRGEGSKNFETVPVGVGFDDGHHRRAFSDDRMERLEVPSNSVRINFDPGQHRNILF